MTMHANEAGDMIPPLMLLLDVDMEFGAYNGAFARVAYHCGNNRIRKRIRTR